MLKLAEQYAKLLKAEILSHRIDGQQIIFVLSIGSKLTMTKKQLNDAIDSLSPTENEQPVKSKSKKKGVSQDE